MQIVATFLFKVVTIVFNTQKGIFTQVIFTNKYFLLTTIIIYYFNESELNFFAWEASAYCDSLLFTVNVHFVNKNHYLVQKKEIIHIGLCKGVNTEMS